MMKITNPDYQQAVEKAMTEALFKAVHDPANNQLVLLSAEITKACLNIIAYVACTSEATQTPAGKRKLCDWIARSLQERISEMQRLNVGKGVLDQVIQADRRH